MTLLSNIKNRITRALAALLESPEAEENRKEWADGVQRLREDLERVRRETLIRTCWHVSDQTGREALAIASDLLQAEGLNWLSDEVTLAIEDLERARLQKWVALYAGLLETEEPQRKAVRAENLHDAQTELAEFETRVAQARARAGEAKP